MELLEGEYIIKLDRKTIKQMDPIYPFFHYVNSPYYPQWHHFPSLFPFDSYLPSRQNYLQGSCEYTTMSHETKIKKDTQKDSKELIKAQNTLVVDYSREKDFSDEIKIQSVEKVNKSPKKSTKGKFLNVPELRCEDKNVNSNLLRVFLRRLELKLRNHSDIFGLVIRKNNYRFSVQDFADWYERNKINHRNYIRTRTAKKLFSLRYCHPEYSAMMRILLQHFLQEQAALCYLTSRKASKEDPRNNFKAIRGIILDLVE